MLDRRLRTRLAAGGNLGQRFQVKRQITGRLESLRGVLFQAVPRDPFEARRNTARRLGQFRRFFLKDRAHGVGRGFAVKRAFAGNHFVENGAEGKNVRPVIDRLTAHLLGRHVPGRSHHHACFGRHLKGGGVSAASVRLRQGQLGQAEIQNLHPAVAREEKILRLQVAMNNAFFVRRRQSARHL